MPEGETVETRKAIQRLVEEFPGLHLRELARRADLDVRVATYHLDRLEKAGWVTILHVGKFKRYFPRRGPHAGEVVDRQDKHMLSLLRNPWRLTLVAFLVTSGPSRLKTISEAVGLSPSKASFHLRKLEGAGLVSRGTQGGTRYAVNEAEKVRDLIRKYRPPPDQVDALLDLWEQFVGED